MMKRRPQISQILQMIMFSAVVLVGAMAVWLVPTRSAAGKAPGSSEMSIGAIRDQIEQAENKRLEIVKTLAMVYEMKGDVERALEYYRLAFELRSSERTVADKLLELYGARKMYREMIPVYESLAESNPGRSQRYLKALAECYYEIGEADKAAEVLDTYLGEYSEYEETFIDVGTIFRDHKMRERAIAVYRKGVEGAFGKSYRLRWELARALAQAERYTEALEEYEEAQSLAPRGSDRTRIEQEMLVLYKKAGVVDQVIAEKEQEIAEIDARLVALYWKEAQAQEEAGNPQAAVAYYEKIVKIAPDSEKGRAAKERLQRLAPE